MDKATILASLETNPEAVVRFVIDNNPSGVQSKLDSVGLLPVELTNPSKQDMLGIILDLAKDGSEDARKMFKYVLSVEYVSDNTNYTGNLTKELEAGIPQKAKV